MAAASHHPRAYNKNLENDDNLKIFNSLEAPLILGVAVIGLLVGCALYHMCYQKVCQRNRNYRHSRNRGPSSAEIRATNAIVSAMFRSDENGRRQLPTATDDPPEYSPACDNLLPTYSQALKYPSKRKDYESRLSGSSVFSSTLSEDGPPCYEESKEESSTSRLQV